MTFIILCLAIIFLICTAMSSNTACLRMNVISPPGIDKVDFELSGLAVSAMNGCGLCMDAHTRELTQAGITQLAIQSALRIAAVINATAMAIDSTQYP